jgi:hypothetical protein
LPCRRDALDVELCDPDWRQPPVGHEACALLPERPRRGQIAVLNVEKTLDAADAAGFLAFETGRTKAGNATSCQLTPWRVTDRYAPGRKCDAWRQR